MRPKRINSKGFCVCVCLVVSPNCPVRLPILLLQFWLRRRKNYVSILASNALLTLTVDAISFPSISALTSFPLLYVLLRGAAADQF